MKRRILLLILLALPVIIRAQKNYQDHIFLKNGNKVTGEIINQFQDKSIRIVISPGDSLTYSNSQISYIHFDRKRYDVRTYKYQPTDPYRPAGIAFTSFIIPGLGQMILGNPIGILFFAGWTVCFVTLLQGLKIEFFAGEHDPQFGKGPEKVIPGLIGGLVIRFWSSVNASHLARVHNLQFREMNKLSGKLSLKPYIGFPSCSTNNKIPVGLSLTFSF